VTHHSVSAILNTPAGIRNSRVICTCVNCTHIHVLCVMFHQVKKVTSEIISSAREREAEALEDLRAKAESDQLPLKKQAATFRSLQASTRTAADYGRRCVTFNLTSQVFSQIPELTKTVAELRKKATTRVKSAPTYQVCVAVWKSLGLRWLLIGGKVLSNCTTEISIQVRK